MEMTAELRQEQLAARLLEFCRLLRSAGLGVTPARVMDVFRALPHVRLEVRDEFRLALRTNLVSSRAEEELFDRLFPVYWEGAPETRSEATELDLEPRPDDRRETPEEPPDVRGRPRVWSSDEVFRTRDLGARWPGESPELERALQELARRLATRPSRRAKPSRRGRRVDLRRSLRKNLRYGVDVVDLARVRRKIRKTRIVLVCDVSGSMDAYNPFLLQLMFGLQQRLKSSRTVVFSTRATEISRVLRRRSVRDTLAEVSRLARHWSGGTRIGDALAAVNRRILREGSASSTVAVVLSDGYDQGDPRLIAREMEALRRRVRTVVWINPLLGSEGYAPLAKGMRAALPHVDKFLPAHDARSLRSLCRELAAA